MVKIYAVMATMNEAGIVGKNIEHLLAQGVDRVLVCDGGSTDETREILKWWVTEVLVIVDRDPVFHQVAVMNDLIRWAGGHFDADWILPVDADEFWFATDPNLTIRDALEQSADEKLYVPVWHHVDWEHRWTEPKMQKVAFRYRPGVEVTMGHHNCNIPGGIWGVLEARELQYQSFPHFLTKIAQQLKTLDPDLPEGDAAHIKRLRGLSRDEMYEEWERMCTKQTVYDPIPFQASPPSSFRFSTAAT